MDNNINLPERRMYKLPEELPGGYLEALMPLSDWIREQVRAAYISGYADGRLDEAIVMGRKKISCHCLSS